MADPRCRIFVDLLFPARYAGQNQEVVVYRDDRTLVLPNDRLDR